MPMDFLSIRNKNANSADIYFYGDIVSDSWGKWTDEDMCPQDIIEMLKGCEDVSELNIYINSGGGNVWAGIAIHNILKRHKAKKIVHIDGLAASIASVIALAGDEIIMPANSFMMIHKAMCGAYGNADEMREVADLLETIEQSIVNVYMQNALEGTEEAHIKELMSAETWLDAKSAAELFKNITVTESIEVAACLSKCRYTKMPKGILLKNSTKDSNESNKITEEAKKSLENFKNFLFLEEEKDNE